MFEITGAEIFAMAQQLTRTVGLFSTVLSTEQTQTVKPLIILNSTLNLGHGKDRYRYNRTGVEYDVTQHGIITVRPITIASCL